MSPSDSVWLREAPAPPWPEVRDASCEVLVVGAGLAGCSAGLALAARGVDVLVVDQDGPGRGASGRNAGFVLLAHVFELPQIAARFGEAAVGDLLSLARDNHARIRERFAASCEHARRGSSMLSMPGDDAEAAALEAAAAMLRAAGADARMTAPPACLSGFATALHLVEDGEVHPARLTQAMASELRRVARGGVLALGDGAARFEGGQVVRFDRALVATNAHAARLVPALEGIVTPQRAQMLATAPAPRSLDHPVYAGWGYDYFRQRADGSVLMGGRRHLFQDAEATADSEPTDEVQGALEAYVREHLPFAAGAEVRHRWAGTMGFSPDELPLLGQAPGLAGVDVLAGFTGHGLGLATALAELWADLVTSRADAAQRARARLFDAARFSPRPG